MTYMLWLYFYLNIIDRRSMQQVMIVITILISDRKLYNNVFHTNGH